MASSSSSSSSTLVLRSAPKISTMAKTVIEKCGGRVLSDNDLRKEFTESTLEIPDNILQNFLKTEKSNFSKKIEEQGKPDETFNKFLTQKSPAHIKDMLFEYSI